MDPILRVWELCSFAERGKEGLKRREKEEKKVVI